MATNVTTGFTDATSSDAIQSFYNKLLLVRGQIDLIHNMPMAKKPLARRQGLTMIFRRYEALPLATTTLTEGVNPSGRAKTKTDLSAVIRLFGDFIEDTDLLIATQPEAVQTENVELLGQQMGETIDEIDRDLYATATNITFANGTTTLTVTEIIDRNDLDRARRSLRNNRARVFSPMIMPSQKVGTGSISPSYWGLVHENVGFDLRHIEGFKKAADYQGAKVTGEIGADENGIRFMSSPNGFLLAGATGVTAAATDVQNTGGFADIYSIFVVGKDAVGAINLAMNGGVITHAFGTSGVADPLNLRQTTGWKKYYTNIVLNQNFMQEIQVAVSL